MSIISPSGFWRTCRRYRALTGWCRCFFQRALFHSAERGGVVQLKLSEAATEIAHQLSFGDRAHFNRRFRETIGLTPRAYRKNSKWVEACYSREVTDASDHSGPVASEQGTCGLHRRRERRRALRSHLAMDGVVVPPESVHMIGAVELVFTDWSAKGTVGVGKFPGV